MKAVVVYDSVSANLRAVAHAIGTGLAQSLDVVVVPVQQAETAAISDADLVVVGGTCHARDRTPEVLQDRVTGWVATAGTPRPCCPAAAYETRAQGTVTGSGRASAAIATALRLQGFTVIGEPESFLMAESNELWPGEEARARAWGHALALTLSLALEGAGCPDVAPTLHAAASASARSRSWTVGHPRDRTEVLAHADRRP